MPFALIHPEETRVFQVEAQPFEVAPPLAWIACSPNVTPQTHRYENGSFVELPAPPATPVVVPQVVTPRQARIALLNAGLLDAVDAAVTASPRSVQIDWEYAIEIRRDNPVIAAMAAQLNLSPAEIDGLFIAAGSVPT